MEHMGKYVRLTQGTKDFGKLIKPSDIEKEINGNYSKDFYTSIHYYTDEHLKKFKETKSIKGIKDVKTDKLVFDLDSKKDLNYARVEALEIISRLSKYNITKDDVEIFFSGMKGFTLVVTLPKELPPLQMEKIALDKIGKGLTTLDKTIYNASRILRVPGTKHQESGLFKIPLDFDELSNNSPEEIREMARESLSPMGSTISNPSEDLFEMPFEVKKEYKVANTEVSMTSKPKQWTNCKWSLLQGNFGSGERDKVMNILAATCRGLGYDKETTYYMCKSALKKSWAKHGEGGFTKEELWNNVINNIIFTDNWQGGQYTCKKDAWLQSYCEGLGSHKCSSPEEEAVPAVSPSEMKHRFFNYAEDFEKNKIKFGLDGLDNNITLCTSTLNGLLGQPGAGKTSAALQYVKNTSGCDVPSMFFSLDMGEPIVFAKIIQNDTGWNLDRVMNEFRSNKSNADKIANDALEKYKNVYMNFRSGLTISDIKNCIEKQNDINGVEKKIKLVIIDYLECIAGPYSDQTANTGFIANQLKDLANELQVCVLLLLQTQKHSTPDVSDPLLSLKGVKGSSLIEQSCSTIMTLWREGYNPEYVQQDKFISFAVVKNRFGPLWRGDFGWEGSRGNIYNLSTEGVKELSDLKKQKSDDKLNKLKNNAGWDND